MQNKWNHKILKKKNQKMFMISKKAIKENIKFDYVK